MPLKLEVREEKMEKRGRGRPRKKPKILEDEESKMTPDMVRLFIYVSILIFFHPA